MRALVVILAIIAITKADPTRDRRIVGGVDNVAGQVPWAVSLRTIAPAVHFCTGSIVNSWWVITSGNCIFGRAPASIGLLLGRVTQDGTGGIQRQGFRVVVHENFDSQNMEFDIGLIQVSVIITFSQNVQSIFISSAQIDVVNAKVSGWGSTSPEMGPTSNNLRTLDVQTINNDDCRARHSPFNAARITENKLCTGNPAGEGWCGTGEGGPLVWNSQLIGIASWNIPCALGFPDVYTRISQFTTWINGIV